MYGSTSQQGTTKEKKGFMSQKVVEKVYDREKDFSHCLESNAAVLPVFLLDNLSFFKRRFFGKQFAECPGHFQETPIRFGTGFLVVQT